jgi:hypothetical protein
MWRALLSYNMNNNDKLVSGPQKLIVSRPSRPSSSQMKDLNVIAQVLVEEIKDLNFYAPSLSISSIGTIEPRVRGWRSTMCLRLDILVTGEKSVARIDVPDHVLFFRDMYGLVGALPPKYGKVGDDRFLNLITLDFSMSRGVKQVGLLYSHKVGTLGYYLRDTAVVLS